MVAVQGHAGAIDIVGQAQPEGCGRWAAEARPGARAEGLHSTVERTLSTRARWR